jgi:hypothetical protein
MREGEVGALGDVCRRRGLVDTPVLGLLDRASTVRELVKCEILELPESWRR